MGAAYRPPVTPDALECDVLVIGGGPAGAAAAQLLASWGRSAILVHRAGAARRSLAESLPSSTRKLLRLLGQLDRVDAAHLYPNDGNVAHWAGASRTTTSQVSGVHVSRTEFDALLREGAAAAGARLLDGVVHHVDGDDPVRVSIVATPDARTPAVCHARSS